MAETYSPNLGLTIIGTGDLAGTWGNVTNTNLGTLLEQSITGYVSQAVADSSSPTTLTIPNGASGVARNMYLVFTGPLTANRTVTVPAPNTKLYFVSNQTTGGFAVTVMCPGQTGVSVPNGTSTILVANGTDVINAVNFFGGPLTSSAFIPTGSAVPTNGMYLPAANTLGFSSTSTQVASVNATTGWVFNAPSTSGISLTVTGGHNAVTNFVSGQGAATSNYDVLIQRGGSTVNTVQAGPNVTLYDSAASTFSTFQNSGGQTEFWQYNGGWAQLFYTQSNLSFVIPSKNVIDLQAGLTNISTNTGWASASSNIYTTGSTNMLLGTLGAASISLGTSSVNRFSIGPTGNTTVNTPSSGYSLTINTSAGLGSALNLVTTAVRGTGTDYINFQDPTGAKGNIGYTTNSSDTLFINNAVGATTFLNPAGSGSSINTNGGWAFGPPASGTCVLISGLAGATGLTINSGSSSSDFCQTWQNTAANQTFANVYGDGGFVLGAPTGGDKGLGTLNAVGLYINGSLVGGTTTLTYTAGSTAGIGASLTTVVGPISVTASGTYAFRFQGLITGASAGNITSQITPNAGSVSAIGAQIQAVLSSGNSYVASYGNATSMTLGTAFGSNTEAAYYAGEFSASASTTSVNFQLSFASGSATVQPGAFVELMRLA